MGIKKWNGWYVSTKSSLQFYSVIFFLDGQALSKQLDVCTPLFKFSSPRTKVYQINENSLEVKNLYWDRAMVRGLLFA